MYLFKEKLAFGASVKIPFGSFSAVILRIFGRGG